MSVKNANELVILVENLLGWSPDPTLPLWRARVIEAGKINKLLNREPQLSLVQLEAAVHYLHRKKKPIASPVDAAYYVEHAARIAADDPDMPISDRIDAAINREREGGLADSEFWIGRLARVAPQIQERVLDEWQQARGTQWPT